jgi:hypothetical protein
MHDRAMPAASAPVAVATRDVPRALRFAVGTATVALWVAIGWGARLDANAFLLVGVPLTVGFQLLVARRPLHALWVRDATTFRLDRAAAAIAVTLAVVPAIALVRLLGASGFDAVRVGWYLCALVGAVAAGFAFRALDRASWRALVACLVVAGGVGILIMVATWRARGAPAPAGVARGLWWLLLYLPVTFVLEEVFFRGALDAWVHRPGEGHGVASALAVSVLWALWHLPLVPRVDPASIVGILVVHVAIGVPLSLWWRRGGNLAGPALAHAAIDAVRNALLG